MVAGMKLTLKAWVLIGLMAMTFLVAFRWLASKSKVKGLETFAAAA
jgi:hypothetical protein